MPGPPKTPTATLKMRGSWRADTRPNEPNAEPGLPRCPAWVDKSGRKWFVEVAKVCDGMGTMSPAYAVALGLLADAIAQYAEAKKTGQGVRSTWADVMRACREFGLTPASKTGLTAAPKSTKGGKEKYFNQA